jgi:hypothetical protein
LFSGLLQRDRDRITVLLILGAWGVMDLRDVSTRTMMTALPSMMPWFRGQRALAVHCQIGKILL